MYLIGNKKRSGFIVTIIGLLLWVYVAITMHVYGLLLGVAVAMVISIRNFIKWGKDKDGSGGHSGSDA